MRFGEFTVPEDITFRVGRHRKRSVGHSGVRTLSVRDPRRTARADLRQCRFEMSLRQNQLTRGMVPTVIALVWLAVSREQWPRQAEGMDLGFEPDAKYHEFFMVTCRRPFAGARVSGPTGPAVPAAEGQPKASSSGLYRICNGMALIKASRRRRGGPRRRRGLDFSLKKGLGDHFSFPHMPRLATIDPSRGGLCRGLG